MADGPGIAERGVDTLACPGCGDPVPDGARFCPACGTPVASGPTTRRTVTVVFVDVVGSTALGECTDPETVREMLLRYFTTAREALTAHGGTVEKFIGDAVMAVFGVPAVHEDDAERAVRAALAVRDGVTGLGDELEERFGRRISIRAGVATGEVTAGDRWSPTIVTGDVANLAARLEQAAAAGEVLLAPQTYQLVRDAVDADAGEPLTLRGKAEPVVPWRARGARSPAPRRRRFDVRFVGREPEMAALDEVFNQVRQGRPRLLCLVGEPGVGKTRLVRHAARQWSGRAIVWGARCHPYGESGGYAPVARLVRSLAGAADAPRQALRDLIPDHPAREAIVSGVVELAGIEPPSGAAADGTWSIRTMLRAVAARVPLVVLIDDLQWAADGMLDLVSGLVAPPAGEATLPLLVLATGRPELLERRPAWDDDVVLRLGAMSEQQSHGLLDRLLGGGLTAPQRDRLVRAADGNPLHLEEVLGMLVDDGRLLPGTDPSAGGAWTMRTNLATVPLPPTVSALVAARLDLLHETDREVLQHAAVLGDRSDRSTLAAMLPAPLRDGLRPALGRLEQVELLRSTGEADADAPDELSFHHQVVREVVYGSLPKRRRIALHAAAADLLVARAPETALPGVLEDRAARAAHHLESSVLLARELGPLSPVDRERAATAGLALGAVSRRAAARGQVASATDLLTRAVRVQQDDDPHRARLLAELGSVLVDAGRYDDAAEVLADARSGASATGDALSAASADLAGLWLAAAREPEGWAALAEPRAAGALSVFRAADDSSGVARALAVQAEIAFLRCRIDDCERAIRGATAAARRSGNVREEAQNAGVLALTALVGPLPVDRGRRRCRALRSRFPDNPFVQARVDDALGVLLAASGRPEQGRRVVRQGTTTLAELGQLSLAALGMEALGEVEELAGNGPAACAALRDALERLDAMGESLSSGGVAGRLAGVLPGEEQAEALALVERARSAAPDEDRYLQVRWRLADARVGLKDAARGGQHPQDPRRALTRCREALDLLAGTDVLALAGEAQLLLGRARLRLDDPTGAADAATAAAGLFGRKGHVVGVAAADQLLATAVRTGGRPPGDGRR